MKLAVVAHTTQRGGAAISNTKNLNYLLDSGLVQPEELMLILPEGSGYGMYEKYLGKISSTQMLLPFSWIFVGAAPGIHRKVYRMFQELLSATLFITDYNRFLKRMGITHIYLNSIVLWCLLPVLPRGMNKTIHIRETFDTSLESRLAKWCIRKYADKIIAINKSEAEPFKDLQKTTVIENPVDMYTARQLRNIRDEIKVALGIGKDTFIISVFAPIGYQKGHDFLLEILPRLPDILFLCVGSITDDKLLEQLEKYPNFKHLPQQEDTDKLYAITDIVMRCEDYFPLGRTVFEGIYAGCFVLLPYKKGDLFSEELNPQMYLYTARDVGYCVHMIEMIQSLYPNGVIDNRFERTSNVKGVSEKLIEKIKHG